MQCIMDYCHCNGLFLLLFFSRLQIIILNQVIHFLNYQLHLIFGFQYLQLLKIVLYIKSVSISTLNIQKHRHTPHLYIYVYKKMYRIELYVIKFRNNNVAAVQFLRCSVVRSFPYQLKAKCIWKPFTTQKVKFG